MGSRGNVYITDTATEGYTAAEFQGGARGIYVYLHWGGYEMPELLRKALARGRDRWTDHQYLTRILIDQLTLEERDQNTGAGVGLTIGDNSYPITVVDLGRQTVAWAVAGEERNPLLWVKVTSFVDYVALENATYP